MLTRFLSALLFSSGPERSEPLLVLLVPLSFGLSRSEDLNGDLLSGDLWTLGGDLWALRGDLCTLDGDRWILTGDRWTLTGDLWDLGGDL